MIFDLTDKHEVRKLKEVLNDYASDGRAVVLKPYSPNRSLSLNNYLHLILNLFALEYGESMKYVKKEIFKKIVNPEIFISTYFDEKTGNHLPRLRSTAELTSAELSKAVSRFQNYSAKEAGIYLPDSESKKELERLSMHIENNDYWL